MSAGHAQIELRVVSKPDYLAVARALVETAAQRMGFDAETAGKVVLAVDEAMANVIRHGYGGKEDQPIWIRIDPIKDEGAPAVQFVIEDQCAGVDLGRIKARPLDEIKPGGLGVHIIQEVMDKVEYRRRDDGRGVTLRMVKRLGAGGSQTGEK